MLDLISAQTVGCGCVADLRSLKALDDEPVRRKILALMARRAGRRDSAHRRRKKRKGRRRLLWIT